jgi:hypothetical protein
MRYHQRSLTQRTTVARCDDCRIEQELFKDLVGPPCPHESGPHSPSAARRHLAIR